MRKHRISAQQTDVSILTLDDDEIMTLTVQSYLQEFGYHVDTENNPERAIERIRTGNYDILLLDYLMSPICGDEVVTKIRAFNQDLYIILLTGHKDLVPPVKTIRELDIQGYYEKSDRFDQLGLLVESCVKSIRQMRTIRHYKNGLQDILEKSLELFQKQPLQQQMDLILEQLKFLFSIEDGFVYIPEKSIGTLFSGIGNLKEGKKSADKIWKQSRDKEENYQIDSENPLLIIPLVDEYHQRIGIIGISSSTHHFPDHQLLQLYVRQATTALQNQMLQNMVDLTNTHLQKAYTRLEQQFAEMTNAVRSMVDAKDIYTSNHSDRVSYYSELIAKSMGKSKEFVKRIRIAGLFHDIGKIKVPDQILLKSGSLTDEEFKVIKRHPKDGAILLSSIRSYQTIAPIVLSHHEHWDGTGYPNGISGYEIPEESRIISVADAFDAMTSHRRYRNNLTLEQAKQQLIEGRGKQFAPEPVDAFLSILDQNPNILSDSNSTSDPTNF
ncbi:HD domain-containing response regulator [Caproicibacterium sp. NSD3]